MQKASLSRRLLAGMAGLAIGLGGAIVLSGPAHAVVGVAQGPVGVTEPTCDDDSGYFEIPEWPAQRKYQIDGQDAAPGVHERGPGTYEIREIGAITAHIYWSEIYVFAPAEDCEEEAEEQEEQQEEEPEQEAEEQEEEPEADEPNVAGGAQLPKTGFPTKLVVGAALSLLTLGSALYFIARRRITSTG